MCTTLPGAPRPKSGGHRALALGKGSVRESPGRVAKVQLRAHGITPPVHEGKLRPGEGSPRAVCMSRCGPSLLVWPSLHAPSPSGVLSAPSPPTPPRWEGGGTNRASPPWQNQATPGPVGSHGNKGPESLRELPSSTQQTRTHLEAGSLGAQEEGLGPGGLPLPGPALTFPPRPVPDLSERGGRPGHTGREGALGRAGGRRQHPRPPLGRRGPRGAPAAVAQEPAVGPEAEPQGPQARGEGGGRRVGQPAAAQPVPALRAPGALRARQEPHEAPRAAHHRLR